MEVLHIPRSAANKTQEWEFCREGGRANMLQLIHYCYNYNTRIN
jgi:hypothetical protein